MKPTPTPASRAEMHDRRPSHSRASYAWHLIRLGEWQEWLSLPPGTADDEVRRLARNLRTAAIDYARRHDLIVESRTSEHGRTVDLKFLRRPA